MASIITVFKTVEGVTPIKIGRKIFVSGLYWQVLPSTQNHIQEARRIVKKEREQTGKTLDIVFLRRHTDVVQAGFVVRGGSARAKKGTVSLAAVAADVLGPTFIAAFELPDGRFALTSAVHNAIVPDSDGVYEAADAKHRMNELWNTLSGSLASNELQVYAPDHLWPGARQIGLEDLRAGARRSHRLRQRTQLTPALNSTVIVWLALSLIGGVTWLWWENHQAHLARELAAERAREIERLRQAAGQDTSDLALMRPWTHQASVPMFLDACTKDIGRIPLSIDGWLLFSAQCTQQGVEASFARTEGRTVLGFKKLSQEWASGVDVRFSSEGDVGTIRWPIVMPAGGDEDLAPLEERLHRLMSWWQRLLVPFETTPAPSTFAPGYRPPENTNDPQLTVPHWQTITWSIEPSNRTPSSLMGSAFDHSGVRLQKIVLTFSESGNLNWSLNGEIYGN